MLGFSITVQGTSQGVYHNKLNSFESSIVVTNSSFSAILEPHVIVRCIQAAVLE